MIELKENKEETYSQVLFNSFLSYTGLLMNIQVISLIMRKFKIFIVILNYFLLFTSLAFKVYGLAVTRISFIIINSFPVILSLCIHAVTLIDTSIQNKQIAIKATIISKEMD